MAAWVVVAGCRVQEPEPPSEVVPTPRASAPPRQVGAIAAAPVIPIDARADEPEPPKPLPPLQVVAPIVTPFPAGAVVTRPAFDRMPVVLFADERAALRRRVSEALAADGVELVPVVELERIEVAAAEGRLVLEGDQQCRAPLTPWEVEQRYFPGRRYATVTADCLEDCRLRATVEDPPDFEGYRVWESPVVSRPHDPRAWQKAASRLRLTSVLGVGGLGLSGTGGSVPPVRFNPPVGVGPWIPGQPEEAPFLALEGTVAGCAHPDPHVGFTWELRVSIDRRGRVERCTAEVDHSQAHASGAGCLCAAVETLAFTAGAAGRRLGVEAVDDGGFGGNARFELVQPGTETWVTRLQESPALARCLVAHPQSGSFGARAVLSLAPDGGVDDVRIEGNLVTSESMRFASCLVQELRSVPLPCRPPGVEVLQASLVVNGP